MTLTPPHRLLSLDLFRGLVIAAMVLVTDPGTYSYRYAQLAHADWNGVTATDIIFPAFLFMVGVAIPYSFAARRPSAATRTRILLRILRRSLALTLLGLAINGFPLYSWQTLRLPGILQRLALCYLLCATLYLFTRRTALFVTLGFGLLALYWAMLKLIPVPGIGAGHLDSYGALPAYVDRAVFTTRHLWAYGLTPGRGVTYDPEGLLSTLPALFSTLTGIVTGDWLRAAPLGYRLGHPPNSNQDPGHRATASAPTATQTATPTTTKALALAAAGLALTLAGWLLSPLLPLNKRLLTSTFALFSTGICLLVFATLYTLVDVFRLRRGLTPWLVLGTNAILAFTLSSVLTSLLALPFGAYGVRTSGHLWLYNHYFAPWLEPKLASLAYALVVVAFNMLLVYPLYRSRIFLRL